MLRFEKLDDIWLAILPFLIAVGCFVGPIFFKYGMLEMALGHIAWVFWLAVVAWLVSVIVVIKRTRWWWVLVSGLPVAVPVVFAIGLLAACASGDCL